MNPSYTAEWAAKGLEKQKARDIKCSIQRPPVEKMNEWTAEQKLSALEFLSEAEPRLLAFFATIRKTCIATPQTPE